MTDSPPFSPMIDAVMEPLTARERELLAALRACADVIGQIPSGALGTQEPAYIALRMAEAVIAKITPA